MAEPGSPASEWMPGMNMLSKPRGPLADAIYMFHEHLPRELQARYVSAVRALIHDHPQPITVGTMFSGTDMVVRVLRHIEDVLTDVYGVPLAVEHKFACESNEGKRGFLATQAAPPLIFENAADLCELSAQDSVSGCPGALVKRLANSVGGNISAASLVLTLAVGNYPCAPPVPRLRRTWLQAALGWLGPKSADAVGPG
jgi:hypothetical protein